MLRIVSGGQAGADRAALDVALEVGLDCGGWCPQGRIAEDGTIPDRYPLHETASAEYPPRARANVEMADATIIFDAPTKKSRAAVAAAEV
ncbi:MAG: putative molybdenum carrier protein [Opitutaceae bacterium]